MRFEHSLLAASMLGAIAGCEGRIHDGARDVVTGVDTRVGTDVTSPLDASDSGPRPDVVAMDIVQPPTDTVTVTDTGSTNDTGVACTGGCPDHAHCTGGVCACDPYFSARGSTCTPTVPGDPATHSPTEVCAQWAEGHRTTAAESYAMGATMCDPGSMSRAAIDDSMRRLNMYRWMVGLTPVSDDEALDANDQQCSLMEHVHGWPGPSNPDPHHPASNWACYTAAGAGAAGSSNISWGTGSAAEAVDNWMQDFGNDTTLGHRRWILHPPLGPVGIGFYGDASCLGVFGSSGGGTSGEWYAYPPPGAVPDGITHNAWSWHTPSLGAGSATVTVTRRSDGSNLAVRMLSLSQGFGDTTVGWYPEGWTPTAGETYQIAIGGITGGSSGGTITYSVSVVSCP